MGVIDPEVVVVVVVWDWVPLLAFELVAGCVGTAALGGENTYVTSISPWEFLAIPNPTLE